MTGRPGLDQETRDAVAALVHRLRHRDEAEDDDRPDPEPFALEFVMALRLRGWRPTPAQGPVPWNPARSAGADPDRHAEELGRVREVCAEASAKLKADETARTAP